MLIVRLVCAVYCLLLTILLLLPDPSRIFRAPADLGVHFLAFAVLGVLVLASFPSVGRGNAPPTHREDVPVPSRMAGRPPRRVLLAGLLIGYAIATELLQSLVPPRTTELRDSLENLLGLAAGTAIWWIARKHVFQGPKGQG